MNDNKSITIIVPAYNEERAVLGVLEGLKETLRGADFQYEILVINDGSTDNTGNLARRIPGIKLINHPHKKGNGAAVKTGVRNAQYDWVLIFDCDGQHQPQYIKDLISYRDEYDLIIGVREKKSQSPILRQPGKKILSLMANYLAGQKIPDLTSGFRLVKKKHFLNFMHLFPNTFSTPATSTLAFLKEGYNVKYVPVIANKRIGKSSLKLEDGFAVLASIFRIMLLFSPLKVFLPITSFLSVLAGGFLIYDLWHANITDTTILLLFTSLLMFFFGFLIDQISAIRREIK